jgi:hypothetical protein
MDLAKNYGARILYRLGADRVDLVRPDAAPLKIMAGGSSPA